MDEAAQQRPRNSLLFVAGDLNDGIGITSRNDQPESASIGPGRSKEKFPGGAGHKARQYAERHRLTVANTTGSWRPTYFGDTTASCIDYIMIPTTLANSLIPQGPLLRMGTRLQHIRCRQHKDHVPVQATIKIPLKQRVRPAQATIKWD